MHTSFYLFKIMLSIQNLFSEDYFKEVSMNIKLKTKHDIKKMRKPNKIVGDILNMIGDIITPGISTYELDKKAYDYILKSGGKPAFLGYRIANDIPPFPGTLCISINEEVVHGIPSKDRIIRSGDIVSVDVGVLKGGFYGDAAYTYMVGEVSEQKKDLCRVTKESLMAGLKAFETQKTLGDVGHAIQTVAESNGYYVVKTFVGHGIGRELHEFPQVPNYGYPDSGIRLSNGMTLAIEPMVNIGTEEVEVLDDGWTVVTEDRQPSAHYEHTSALTENGLEILTMFDNF